MEEVREESLGVEGERTWGRGGRVDMEKVQAFRPDPRPRDLNRFSTAG